MKELILRVKNNHWIRQHQSLIMKGGVIALFLILFFIMMISKTQEKEVPLWEDQKDSKALSASQEKEEQKESEEDIIVDVSGAVKESGIVQLKAKSRVADAIEAAGGLTQDANLSSVNRASILQDGDKLYIPTDEETDQDIPIFIESVTNEKNQINLNTATVEELQEIKGVGPATAEKILIYRGKHGNFSSIEELMNVDGIGEKTFEKIKDSIKI